MDLVRYGVIGISGIGNLHCRLARKNTNTELVALADINTDVVKKKSAQWGVHGFTDYRDMLDAGIVDAVSIATPHHLHAIIGQDCLEAGVHIFVEKPLANRVSEADAMIAKAKSRNLKICVGHQYRTHRSSKVMKQLIDNGNIGKIMRVLWTWIEFRPESYYARDIWRCTWRHAGGGVLMNQASHYLDLICWMIGKPAQVSAFAGSQLHQAEIEDMVCASVVFENGAFGSLQFTVNQPKGYNIRQVAGDKGVIIMPDAQSLTGDQDEQILVGRYKDPLPVSISRLNGIAEQPEMIWQPVELPGTAKKRPRKFWGWKSEKRVEKKPRGLSVLMNSFIDAIINGGEPEVSGKSAHPTVEFINAIILSSVRGKTVTLPVDRDEYDALFDELRTGKTKLPTYSEGRF